MKRKRFLVLIILMLLACLVVIPVSLLYRQVQQEKANTALIAAAKNNDTTRVIAALKEGADANARDLPPDTRSFWQRLWDGLRGRRRRTEEAPTALLVALLPQQYNVEHFPENPGTD